MSYMSLKKYITEARNKFGNYKDRFLNGDPDWKDVTFILNNNEYASLEKKAGTLKEFPQGPWNGLVKTKDKSGEPVLVYGDSQEAIFILFKKENV